MKRGLFIALNVFALGAACAQQALPKDMVLLNEEITLSYAPKFDARCTQKKYEKKSSDFFGNRTSEIATHSIYEDSSGELKYAMGLGGGGNFMRIIVGIKEGGFGFASTPPIWEASQELPPKEKATVLTFLENILKELASLNGIGKPLRQGSSIMTPDICKIFPGSSSQAGYGVVAMTVVGTAFIQGRKSLVMNGAQSIRCILPGGELDMDYKGWQAIDVQSGLFVASSFAYKARSPTGASATSTVDTECSITGAPTQAQQHRPSGSPGSKTVELRLIELKSLLDKGLITQEQFEQKRAEIVKAL